MHMSIFIAPLTYIYSKLLSLYPHNFRNEFAEEMQVVFRESVEEAIHEGIVSFAFVCLKELGDYHSTSCGNSGMNSKEGRQSWSQMKVRQIHQPRKKR